MRRAPSGLEPVANSSRPIGRAIEQHVAGAENDDGDDDDQRHAGDLQAGHVEPGLRDLVGADLVAGRPDRVETAKDRHRGQRDDDGRDLSPGDDKAVEQTGDTADRASGRQADADVEPRIGLNHAGRHVGRKADHRGDRKVDVAGDQHQHLGERGNDQQGSVHRHGGQVCRAHHARVDDGDRDGDRQHRGEQAELPPLQEIERSFLLLLASGALRLRCRIGAFVGLGRRFQHLFLGGFAPARIRPSGGLRAGRRCGRTCR